MQSILFLTTIELWQLTILIAGVFLVIVELFYPGFGFPGITGIILMLIGVILIAKNIIQALILILLLFIILGIALYFVLKSVKSGRLSKSLILNETLDKNSGYQGTEDLMKFLGKEGVTITILRPAGTAEFDGFKIDVVSESEFIQMNSKVKIIKVEGRRIVVRQI